MGTFCLRGLAFGNRGTPCYFSALEGGEGGNGVHEGLFECIRGEDDEGGGVCLLAGIEEPLCFGNACPYFCEEMPE